MSTYVSWPRNGLIQGNSHNQIYPRRESKLSKTSKHATSRPLSFHHVHSHPLSLNNKGSWRRFLVFSLLPLTVNLTSYSKASSRSVESYNYHHPSQFTRYGILVFARGNHNPICQFPSKIELVIALVLASIFYSRGNAARREQGTSILRDTQPPQQLSIRHHHRANSHASPAGHLKTCGSYQPTTDPQTLPTSNQPPPPS